MKKIKLTDTLSAKEIRHAVEVLKKNGKKPVWRFTWEFPFLQKFYVFDPKDILAAQSIDDYVSKAVPLTTTLLSNEGAILNAIRDAKRENKVIIKLGIPLKIQSELLRGTGFQRKTLGKYYGIPVEKSKTMQITTEFTRFQRK